MSIKEKLMKNSTVKLTSMLENSEIFDCKDVIVTSVPMINVALSGRVDGGLQSGLLSIAAPSRHFKSAFSLLLASAFIKQYPDGIILFYDSEFGSPQSYFDSFGIPSESVVHTPIVNIEELKFDLIKQLVNINRGDKVFILIDSIGNLASKKELDDALDGNDAQDMTRAKQLKSLWRMVTPYLTLKDIPMVAVQHVYMTQEKYSKPIMSGGTGGMLSSDNVWILGRQQEKEDNELSGYNFIINIEKSRYVKEKSKIPISVSFDEGVNRWSGLLELAVEAGVVVKPKVGWYAIVDAKTGELSKNYRAGDLENNGEIWQRLLKEETLPKFIKEKYTLLHGSILNTGEVENTDGI